MSLAALFHYGLVVGEVFRKEKVRHWAPQYFFRGVTQEFGHLPVDKGGAVIFVYGPDAFVGGFDDPPVFFLAGLESLEGLLLPAFQVHFVQGQGDVGRQFPE